VQHFRNIHPGLNADDYMEASVVTSETEFPRKCGFCRHRFSTRQERINHIGEHFKQGKCMLDWRDEDDDGNSHGSDDGDDDDEDRPSGDGFDGSAPPYPPPELDPRGGSGPKDFGSGGSSGSGTEPPHGGFFQFQLSQGESQLYCAVQQSRPSTIQRDPQQSTTSSESGKSTIEQCSSYTKHVSAEGDNKAVVARDAFTQSVMDEVCEQVEIADQRTYAVDALQPEPRSDEGYIKIDGFINSIATIPKSTERLQQVLSDEHRLDLLGGSKVTARQSLLEVPASTHSFSSVKLLGAGGFSTVDEVVHLATGLRIVRKTLKNRTQTAIEELRKEASVLRKLRHPHISRFHEESTRGDRMSMLLSPIAETTLALWLEQSATQKPANLAETITKMFGCLAASVRYLHEQRPIVKHMDIKPQNILIIEGDQEFPHVVLTDFGISSSDELCDEQAKPLTRQYVAPEVLEGFTRKAAADIWSLGCVFAEMASVPFSQDNTAWLAFRKEFSGRTGKYYWQDVEGLQDRLSAFLDTAKTLAEQTVVCTLQTMLRHEPDERPDAASLSMIFTPAPCCLTWPNDKAIFPAPHEELGALEMFSRNDGMNAHVQPHVQGESLVQASVSLSSARLWLEECSHTHDACRHQLSSDAKILPTRLVDISSAFRDDSYVRIVDSTSLEPSTDYVALSDVWSRSQPLLSSETQSTFYTQLPLQTQPRKFQDALSVAQSLGYSYMWIDSLCVLQDSEQDKQRECKRMASVFRNAALTIVFGQLGDSIPIPSPGGNSGGSHQLLPASTFTTPGFAWDTRAWALQDRLLSRRFLHLGAQMYWECNSLKASQALPRGLPPLLWEKVHTRSDTTSASPRRSKSRARYETAVQLRLHERASREKYCACPLSSHARSTEKNTTQNLQDDRDTLTHKSGDSLSPLSEIDAQNAHITDGSDTSPCSSSGSKPCQSSDLPESFDQLHNGHGTSHAWSVEHPVEHRTTGLNMVGTSGASLTSNANDLAYLDGSYPSIIERSMNGDNNGGMGS
jgi:serine/threonine protein kinase